MLSLSCRSSDKSLDARSRRHAGVNNHVGEVLQDFTATRALKWAPSRFSRPSLQNVKEAIRL